VLTSCWLLLPFAVKLDVPLLGALYVLAVGNLSVCAFLYEFSQAALGLLVIARVHAIIMITSLQCTSKISKN
jgi:hypothetical protein